ncbi:DMT family transporter [Pseudohalocynthiibacter aestuariivivens]|uniref:DMT family transporter n=1 Tax=Pseudohalocynthiibacter aestuariivivens TaxID=1591409 RepID=A0ABV5JIJ5_9RHOB|nr:DMT family transporter [Pseudohalocynthiibacter aestuariivivens]
MTDLSLTQTAQQNADVLKGNVTCVAAVAFFSLGFPAAEILLQSWGALSLIAVRNALGAILILLVWLSFEGIRAARKAPWLRGIWIGALGFGSGSTLLVFTQSLTDPVVTALAAATMPVSGVALEVVLDGRRLTFWFVSGVVLVLAGGFIATGINLSDAGFGLGAVIGLLASALFAWGSRATVKNLPGLSSLGMTTVTSIGMMGFCIAAYCVGVFFETPGTNIPVIDTKSVGLMIVYSCVALAISQVLWIRGVGGLGIGVASFHLNAAPFYVMLILLAMGRDWNWQQAIGAAVLATGVIVAQRRNGKSKTVATP